MSGKFIQTEIFRFTRSIEQDSNNESLEKLIKQYSTMFDLTAPIKGCVLNQGRYLFLEGDMKYKDSVSKVGNSFRNRIVSERL